MNAQQQIEKFQELIESNYLNTLHELISKNRSSLTIDFSDLAQLDPELSEDLLSNPEDAIKSAELSLQQFDITQKLNLKVRFSNLPKSQRIMIRNIRSSHIDNLIAIEGLVKQASDVRPQVISAKFECPSCGNAITLLQLEPTFREPTRCSCGRRGKFRLLSKELVDAQRLVLEEAPESLEGGEQPKRISVFLREDLVEPKMEKKTTPGSKIRINGIVKEVPIPSKTGGQSTRFDLSIETNHIEPIIATFEEIEITKEEEEKIKELARDPKVYEKFIQSIAPSIYGHEDIKGALVLQLMGGVRKDKKDGTFVKGDIHILLVGDPGAAKSSLLMYLSKAAPKARFVSGKGVSSAGLCVAPDSLIAMNPGSISKIEDIVELNLNHSCNVYSKGIWYSNNKDTRKKIFTLDSNLKVKPKEIDKLWKLEPPEYMVKLLTSYGKEVTITPNTKLYSFVNGELVWKEADTVEVGSLLAGCREFRFENTNKVLTISLIKSNPIVQGVKAQVKEIIKLLCRVKDLTIRKLAKELKINENKLYFHWVNDKARGNIHLKDLLELVELSGYPLEEVAKDSTLLSLRRGCRIKIPVYLNEDFMYFAGLIAGDGDICNKKGSAVVRFSNNSKELQKKFKETAFNLFGINCYLSSERSNKRAESWRFGSKIVVEILNKLGIPNSPKAHMIDMKNSLLTMPNNLLKPFLSGYFDSDGGSVERKKGGCSIEVTTASKEFAKKLQLVLTRFGIQSKLRIRPPTKTKKLYGHTIKAQYNQHIIKISGKKNLKKFRDNIGFGFTEKKDKLNKIIGSIHQAHTNIDVIPDMHKIIKRIMKKHKITTREIFGYKTSDYFRGKFNLSVDNLKKITKKLSERVDKNDEDLKKLILLSDSDVILERVIKKERVYNHNYKYVYDLTVSDSHNFIVNGLVVHNTATIVKDEFLRGWALEAGAIVLANGGLLLLDEMDKMDKEDTSALHEAMSLQTITISKANIQATLLARTAVLAAANPKFGRFDPYEPIASQIDLPPALINRFDLIFPVRDLPNVERDTRIASHVLEIQQNTEINEPAINAELLKKYIAYVRQNIFPVLTKGAIEEIKSFYVTLRNSGTAGEGGIRPIPISARQLESLVRLAEGSARIRLSNKVTRMDAKNAIEILKHCLMQVGFDYETGQIDIDRVSTGITAAQRNKIVVVRDLINEFESKGKKTMAIEEVISAAIEKGINESQVEEVLEKLKRSGDIFEPKRGFIQKI